ncbi:MAG TPA: nicotinate-nucleotide adenylyltransferase [Caulobacteraceae bacterium]|jgi:nicotinate-nucleotide adenylyltransferase
MHRAIAARRPAAGRPLATRTPLRLAPGLRVGLYGGSFNPPHLGHAHVADYVRRRLRLDRILWLVTPGNPLKDDSDLEPLAARMAEVRALAGSRDSIVTDLERRVGSRYTVDTVRWLKARYPGVRFVWIMGADNLAGFHRWKGWVDLMREIPVAVVSRPELALKSRFAPAARRFASRRLPLEAAALLPDQAPPAWVYIPAPFRFVSSTALRKSRLKNGRARAI